jgi:hypothetical protein
MLGRGSRARAPASASRAPAGHRAVSRRRCSAATHPARGVAATDAHPSTPGRGGQACPGGTAAQRRVARGAPPTRAARPRRRVCLCRRKFCSTWSRRNCAKPSARMETVLSQMQVSATRSRVRYGLRGAKTRGASAAGMVREIEWGDG